MLQLVKVVSFQRAVSGRVLSGRRTGAAGAGGEAPAQQRRGSAPAPDSAAAALRSEVADVAALLQVRPPLQPPGPTARPHRRRYATPLPAYAPSPAVLRPQKLILNLKPKHARACIGHSYQSDAVAARGLRTPMSDGTSHTSCSCDEAARRITPAADGCLEGPRSL